MTNPAGPSLRKKLGTLLSILILGFIALIESYSVLAIALDTHPPHRLWWENLSLAIASIMLAALLLGLYLLLKSSKLRTGLALAIANLLAFYAIVLFEIFTGGLENKASMQLIATYSIVLLAGIAAAIHLKRRASRSTQTVSS